MYSHQRKWWGGGQQKWYIEAAQAAPGRGRALAWPPRLHQTDWMFTKPLLTGLRRRRMRPERRTTAADTPAYAEYHRPNSRVTSVSSAQCLGWSELAHLRQGGAGARVVACVCVGVMA